MKVAEQKMVLMTAQELTDMNRQLVMDTVSEMMRNAHQLNDDCLLTITQACEFMHITRATLNKWTKEKVLPHLKKGKRIFYKKSDIMEKKVVSPTKK